MKSDSLLQRRSPSANHDPVLVESPARSAGKRPRTADIGGSGRRPIQRKADAKNASAQPTGSDTGRSMPEAVQSKMEGAFNADFSNVKVHEGEKAPSVGALAYTQGSDIHFAPGQYQPNSQSGQELLGHELAHVVQQSQGRVSATGQAKGVALNDDSALEREADVQGAMAARGQRVDGTAGPTTQANADSSVAQPKLVPGAGGRGVIQRAIGFEFEFGEWITCHDDEEKTELAKGELIKKGDGFKAEGEDGAKNSAIEVVTKPYATKDEAKDSVGKGQKLLQDMAAEGKEHKASKHGGQDNVLITPNGAAGKMQASPAVPLDQLAALYSQGVGGSYKGYVDAVQRELNSKSIKKKYLNGKAPSPELEGLIILTVDYLSAGASSKMLSYPKSAFKIMARTSFDKMFSLLPEHGFFGQAKNRDLWVELVMTIANKLVPSIGKKQDGFKTSLFGKIKRDSKGMAIPNIKDRKPSESMKDPMMGMNLIGMDELPEDDEGSIYQLNITREEWLKSMPDEDLLSKANDMRFEGMGAYGDSTDLEQVAKLGEDVGEKVASKVMGEDTVEDVSASAHKPREAPIFEMRGLSDMFGITQDIDLTNWVTKVEQVFGVLEKAMGEASFAPQGKPDIPKDVDNPKIWDKKA